MIVTVYDVKAPEAPSEIVVEAHTTLEEAKELLMMSLHLP